MTKPVVIIGAGWSGAVVAHQLAGAGLPVEVLERANVVGGHSRMETLCGCHYEPNGPHILHTDNPKVADFLDGLGLRRSFRFRPLTEIDVGDGELRLMSWPIQVDELKTLPDWKRIKRELNALPKRPYGDNFETYAVTLMGRTLYELFIEGYTRKQWACEPSTLSSSFAPKRIDLRRDGNRDLFRDAYCESWPFAGVNGAIGQLLQRSAVTCGADITIGDLEQCDASAFVITAALDDLLGKPDTLAWRGVHLRSTFHPTLEHETLTPAYVINRPHMHVPYTRTIETKHASRQSVPGTVISEEYPGAPAKHYPVATVNRTHEKANGKLQVEILTRLAPTPVFYCGRLATYRYINQDEAIADAWSCADEVLRAVKAAA